MIAHRGASAKAPPNSRSAFLQAIADKADYIELDVQETKDGIVVVHHDKDYKLSSNIDKAVHELTWAETAAIDIGSSFSKDFAGEAVISLEETLKLAKDKINVLIELKYYGYNQNLEQRVLDLVHQTGMEEQVRYMSLNLEGIERLKSLAPTASVGYISSAAKIGDLSKINLDFVAVSTSLATKKFISHIQRKGKKAAVWTIDDTDEMLKLANFNIDAIITNRPDKLREVLQRHKKMTKAEILLSIYHNLWKE